MDIQELRREAQTMQPQLTADRRCLHRNPEAGAVLPETVAYVKGAADGDGIPSAGAGRRPDRHRHRN